MPVPAISTAFQDLLDPRFSGIFFRNLDQLADMVPDLFDFPTDNGRDQFSYSEVGEMGDWDEFTGTVTYDEIAQGFDVFATHKEFASGFQVERKLFDDDQYHIMDERPMELSSAYVRTRQKHAARLFNNAFSNDAFFYSHSEGTPLCSDSHLTNASGVSTATGFDNVVTTGLSAVALTAMRNQFVGFRSDRGNRIAVVPDEIWIPNDLYERAFEIVASAGKVDVATNNANVHQGAYTIREWNYMTSAANYFLVDSAGRKKNLKWVDRVDAEFAFAEDIDTLIAKWRGYSRYSWLYRNWRWILGANVS